MAEKGRWRQGGTQTPHLVLLEIYVALSVRRFAFTIRRHRWMEKKFQIHATGPGGFNLARAINSISRASRFRYPPDK